MGEDKSLLSFGKSSILEHTLVVLGQVSSDIILVLSGKQTIPDFITSHKNIKVARDLVQEQGPLQGIADGARLLRASSQMVFLCSCDIPFLSSDWLERLQDQLTDQVDGVCSNVDGFDNPLLGIYRKHVVAKAQSLLNRGGKRPRQLWEGERMKSLVASGSDEWYCRGVNTKSEYHQALRYLKKLKY